jgi:hypothetical protein
MDISRLTRFLLTLNLTLMPIAAPAIPSFTPHCHDDGCITWPGLGVDPEADAHQHRNLMPLDNVPGFYKTYAAWDNFLFRYNHIADRTLRRPQDATDYGHGYMAQPAVYGFADSVPVWAQFLIVKVEDYWERKVTQDGALNVFGVPTSTRIDFIPGGGGNILIQFEKTYPIRNAQGQVEQRPFPLDSEIDTFGNWPGNQPPPGGGPGGGRDGTLAFWTPALQTLTFNSQVNWYQDVALPDIDQSPIDNNAQIGVGQFDFVTTALHEWGHVLGLDHVDQGVRGATMFETQARRGTRGNGGFLDPSAVVNRIDLGSLTGAQNLYTIAVVPEPATILLVMTALVSLVAGRRSLETIVPCCSSSWRPWGLRQP